jgi:hypothetical protein
MAARPQYRQSNRFVPAAIRIPSAKLECAYYLALLYSLTADVWGISVPLLAGALVLGVSGRCFLQLRSCAKTVYGPIALLIACVIAFLLVQVGIHDVSILDGGIRNFIIWILQLIIVHSLCLRQGFSLRYPLVLFVFGLAMLPFLSFDPGEIERARVGLAVQGGLSHPGGIAEWFGFFAIYFAVRGVENKRLRVQICAWLIAVGCLFISVLAVSRAILFAVALALTFAFRSFLRRGFVGVLVLIILTGVIYESGLFDQAVSYYTERGMEETGREKLWPAAIERIFSSPLVSLFGVGEPNVVYVLSPDVAIGPHNAFLHFWLASGVVPFAFFFAFWIQAAWKSWHAKGQESDAYRLPYLVFTFVDVMFSDAPFMTPWALLALSVAAGSAVVYGKQRLLVVRVGNKIRFGLFPGHKSPETDAIARSQS